MILFQIVLDFISVKKKVAEFSATFFYLNEKPER